MQSDREQHRRGVCMDGTEPLKLNGKKSDLEEEPVPQQN